MSRNITVTFLGTTSGGGPTETRNCSSLVVEPLGDGQLWMVDCAEGTVRQFALQPYRSNVEQRRLRVSQVNKIFITHMHADHTMGLLTLLRNVLGIPKPPSAIAPDAPPPNASHPRVEIFGPRGVRRMLRTLWHLTHTHSEHPYVVHELLFKGEQPSIAADVSESDAGIAEVDVRRESECVGRDIWCDDDGFWRGIVDVPADRHRWGALVDAGPIEHRDPCIGYIIREIPQYQLTSSSPLPRKLVLLGDTCDPSPLIPLIHAEPPLAVSSPEALPEFDPTDSGFPIRIPVSLLVHEATDAYIPPSVDQYERTGRNRTQDSVEAKTRDRGHSTPAMAGAFARRIGAERLVLNHIGARFPAPEVPPSRSGLEKFRQGCMREIERQAAQTWGSPSRWRVHPQAAWDFLSVVIPPNPARVVEEVGAPSGALVDDMAEGALPGSAGGVPGAEESGTEVEMEEGRLQSAAPLSIDHADRLAERYGSSAESMGVAHHRKRGRDGSAGRVESSGASGRGGYEGKRGYGTWARGGGSGSGSGSGSRGGGGRGARGDGERGGRAGFRGRGRGGGYENKRARGRGG
ncbi:hypothetical protein PYCCODRAFT_1411075 [Trametes coccinea BRFM310]|uniref:Metallo-beta-lactamase domain-containing protein n=1 Tax=Trametes coccinea (strain BRFM310) TaxID=1353009 RepID=A0A1Y2IM69_TRAC3|nr:hypothetical protein PYCCODRAFT_1411075 [Trametes coccinea BRFM310]